MDKKLRMMLVQFKQSKAYWFDFLITTLVFPVYAILNFFLWKTIIANGFKINFGTIFSYYVIMFLVTRVMNSSDSSRIISRQVVRGSIAYWLIRPMSFFSSILFRRAGTSLFAFLTIIPFFIATFLVFPLSITGNVYYLVAFTLSLCIGFFLSFVYYFSLGLSALWIEENWGLMWMVRLLRGFLSGAWLPLYLFPEAVKNVLLLLPFKYMGYFQVMLLQGKIPASSLLQEFIVMLAWVVVFYVLARIVWRIGEKHIEGHGV